MKILKIYFEAFKSILNKEIDFKENCIGFVGINESGKSNILYAIHTLGGERKLTLADRPRMKREKNPSIKFEFEPDTSERIEINRVMQAWAENNTLIGKQITESKFNIIYHIEFNVYENQEKRLFSFKDFIPNKDFLILKYNNIDDNTYKVKFNESFVSLDKAIIIQASDLIKNEEHLNIITELEKINENIISLEGDIESLLSEKSSINIEKNDQGVALEQIQKEEDVLKGKNLDSSTENKSDPASAKLQKKLDKIIIQKQILESQIKNFNLPLLIIEQKDLIKEFENKIKENEIKSSEIQTAIVELNKLPSPDPVLKRELTKKKNAIDSLEKIIQNLKIEKQNKINSLNTLQEPLKEKYTDDISELNKYLPNIIHDTIQGFLPKVVFWEHSKDYILNSNTLFSDILDKTDLNKISRPLLNLFRIGLNIKTIKDLKFKINEIQEDDNERSRIDETLNSKINSFIQSVWIDYDQKIKITLEKERIRIEFYDPKYYEHSFYNMDERSQGAQTFISFLMTIGAEAKKGVLKNTVLLLDEPETHLHPSGVRFMLKELVRIAEEWNIVVFATHSIFMIDRENYNRHIILVKEKEQTIIKPSRKDKIGYFMQEEVLYSALDINLNKDFTSTNQINFVFEGDGDALLFEHFYDKILNKGSRPFLLKNTSFYQGGKCSDIKKYFCYKPIQLSTRWIFILDNDQPANDLKKFIEGKYKEYLNKDIFVFQYTNDIKDSKEIELEDLIPSSFLIDTYIEMNDQLDINFTGTELKKLITKTNHFSNYNEEIMDKYITKEQKEDFKGQFKEVFNKKIKTELGKITVEAPFQKSFPDYFEWANNVISSIKTTLKET